VYLTGDYSDYREIVTQGSSANANRWLMFVNITTGILGIQTGATGITTSFTVPQNTWTHLAFVNNSSSYTVYANGTSVGTGTNTVTPQNTYVTVGAFQSGAEYFQGYISNVRITNTAVYTSAFTPSTTPLTAISGTSFLTCQSNRFIDNSANTYAITANGNTSVQRFNPFGTATAYSTAVIGGSGYFDGSGDLLTLADDPAWDYGSGDFTIEFWYYPVSNTTTDIEFIGQWTSGSTDESWSVGHHWTNGLVFFWSTDGSTDQTLSSATILTLNAWNHIAVSKSGTTVSLYLNGARLNTGTLTGSIYNSSRVLDIGGRTQSGANQIQGYLSDVRTVKGTAVYNPTLTTLTVPTAPLTAITNTALLMNFTNGAIFDNAMMNDLETVGNAQISTSVYKYGTGSLYFDGTGDALRGQNNTPNLQFGTGNFTVECWLYQTATNTYPSILEIGNHATQPGGMLFIASDGSTITAYNGAAGFLGTAIAPTLNTWNHIAWVRNNGVFKIYVNGVGNAGFAFTGNLNTSSSVTIGAEVALSAPYTYQGYMDELRVTKGYARYTANFTAPTAAFQNIGPY